MRRFFLLILAILLCSGLGAQQIAQRSFAIFVDKATAQACRAELEAYRDVITAEGLPAEILAGDWATPEQVRDRIRQLYRDKGLEGAVFVGDIPVAMVRGAQHFTSAFKMDQRQFPMFDSSVPSDRFYDDFGLKFRFIAQDSTRHDLFYYWLTGDSAQRIHSDIYTGRIRAVLPGEEGFAQIRAYLKKAVAAHKENNPLDRVVSYTGEGSFSNSLSAWKDESITLREQMPAAFRDADGAKFYMFYMYPDIKDVLAREMARPDVDHTSLTIDVAASKAGALVFKEIYFNGSTGYYFKDQFYEIYNNSDDVQYVDGLCIGTLMPATASTTIYNWIVPDGHPENYVYLGAVWQIPGSGTDYPVKPGESIIIAQGAQNHKLIKETSPVDLSKAEFETFMVNQTVNPDNPESVNMTLKIDFNVFGTQWLSSVFGCAYVIFFPDREFDNTTWVQPDGYSTQAKEFPIDCIVDAVELVNNATKINLKETTFRLEEVTVVATQSKAGKSTASTISRQAMDHMQASSLTDLMAFLPGASLANPVLSSAQQFNIRTAFDGVGGGSSYGTDMNSLGTSIIVDGAPVSANANMQALSPSISGGVGATQQGIDSRSISTDNIESVEVIRGVASAEYGDLTSGAGASPGNSVKI